jgi:hypothetical protein
MSHAQFAGQFHAPGFLHNFSDGGQIFFAGDVDTRVWMGTDTELKEFKLFARYLIGQDAPDELFARYARANSIFFGEGCNPKETATLALACQHPWTLPYLDAACGLLRPDHLLRKRLLVMTAILETTPALADHFLSPSTQGRISLLTEVGWTILLAVGKGIVGLVLFGKYIVR